MANPSNPSHDSEARHAAGPLAPTRRRGSLRSDLASLWPGALLIFVTLALAWLAWRQSDKTWIYPLDDSYIHLSLARTLAEQGQWGFGSGRTAFSSSSPGYTLLLALGFQLTGPWAGWPLLINGLAALKFMRQSWRLWPRFAGKSWLWLLLMGLLPFPLLVLVGLEHLLHLCLMLGLVHHLSRLLAGESMPPLAWGWAVGAALLRYETGFLVVVAGLTLLARHRWRAAFTLSLTSLMPLLLVGFWSASQGGTWLPLSVLLKGHPPGSLAWLGAAVQRLYDNPFVLTTLLALLLGRRITAAGSADRAWLDLTLGIGLLHLLLAEVGGYRYEAYWLGLAWLGLGRLMPDQFAWNKVSRPSLGLVGLLLFPLLIRSGFFLWHYPQATRNIYQQPYQAARFLRGFYPQQPMGLNDIGLGTWLGQVELTDMVGVGDQAVFDLRQRERFTAAALDSLLQIRGVALIVGHELWLGARMPSRFQPVATWTVPDNFILAGETLTFWSTVSARDSLRARLRSFEPSLPAAVEIRYLVSP
jgi:hypothetical protein